MLLLLDRDGVINRDRAEGILSLDKFIFMPRAVEAIAELHKAGIQLAICTNQSAVGRGRLSEAELQTIHDHMCGEIEKAGGKIDKIYFAPDLPEAPTPRRKPGPGMLLEALRDFDVDAAETIFIGDMLRDLEAAKAAGCPSILVRCGKGESTLKQGIPPEFAPIAICEDLYAASQVVIEQLRASL